MDTEKELPFAAVVSSAKVERHPSGLVPSRQILTGRHIRLEPLDPAVHAEALYAASHSDEQGRAIWTYLPEGPWPDATAYTQHLQGNAANLARIFYALVDPESGLAVGQASFMDMDAASGVIEIGYIWFAPSLQRTRGATEAMFLMLDYALSGLRYRRMQWRCNAHNEKSRNAARRLGFRYEGTFYNHMIYKGLNRDTAWYSILDTEWPEVRERLMTWLEDANFDAAGTAKSSLAQVMAAREARQRPR